jgi:hypothetical protein
MSAGLRLLQSAKVGRTPQGCGIRDGQEPTDKNRVSERIAQAEWALAVRARELFHADSEHLQERQAVDTAIYALQALRCTTPCAARRNGKDRGKAA